MYICHRLFQKRAKLCVLNFGWPLKRGKDKQQQQPRPFICTHTTDKIITIDIVKLVERTACPK